MDKSFRIGVNIHTNWHAFMFKNNFRVLKLKNKAGAFLRFELFEYPAQP